jgi:NADH:ubiquinone oxidoreductase subunit D
VHNIEQVVRGMKINVLPFNKKKKCFFVNFGFQYPASHGVLRMFLQMVGEVIYKVDIHVGFLYRSSGKLIATIIFIKALPVFDRLDYVLDFDNRTSPNTTIPSKNICNKTNISLLFQQKNNTF